MKKIEKFIKKLFLFALLNFSPLASEPCIEKGYEQGQCPEDVWALMEPYLLPENHKIRSKLDQIFSERALRSTSTLRKAGFNIISGKKTSTYVLKHPRLPGYIIKGYLDSQDINSSFKLYKRAEGARVIQSAIDKYEFSDLVKVPKKWIYPLPQSPAQTTNLDYPNYFVLIAIDSGTVGKDANKYLWKKSMTIPLMNALFIIISEHNLIDSIRIDNVPFCHDGLISFIDTEYYDIPRSYAQARFWKFYEYLSSDMLIYLKSLVENSSFR